MPPFLSRSAPLLLLLVLAGGAHAESPQAQTQTQTRAQGRGKAAMAAFQAELASKPALALTPRPATADADLAAAAFAAPRDRDGAPAIPKGTVKTSLDHSFSPSGGVTGAVGYLCGLAPGPDHPGGVASSYGDRGTFLGGQLHLAF